MDGIYLLTVDERCILQAHCKAVAGCQTDEERTRALARGGWDRRRIRLVGELYAKLRRNGMYVEGVDHRGQLLLGSRANGRLDEMVEQRGAEYEQRGLEMLESLGIGGGVFKLMEA